MRTTTKHQKLETISLKAHPEISERWIQDRIADDPSILGLGDLVLKDRERTQPRAGRLDLLLQDSESNRRYEVELQLGRTDEAHIIRALEYWDIERKRYPQYEHCAVIVAEDITSRFLNIVSLFNGHIPIIAIQVKGVKLDDGIGLLFTRVLDELRLGLVDEDEEAAEVTDRAYWEKRGSKGTVKLVDQMLELVHECDPTLQLNYNKFYIGLATDGQPNNFVLFRPRKTAVVTEIRLERSDEVDQIIQDADFDTLEYSARYGQYRMRIEASEVEAKREALARLFRMAFESSKR